VYLKIKGLQSKYKLNTINVYVDKAGYKLWITSCG